MLTKQENLNWKAQIEGLDYQSDVNRVDAVVEQSCSREAALGFFTFARQLILRLRHAGKHSTADTYTTVINSFKHFYCRSELRFSQLDTLLAAEYEAWLKGRGVCKNTISFYMRNLRAIYNRAVDAQLVTQRSPFKHVYTGIDKTVKRAVPVQTIRQIRELDLSGQPLMDYARDLFMFSFYTRGMSFIDMAFLRKSDLRHGVLSYCRQKTGQRLVVKWECSMQQIVDKYATADTPYLLPIIRNVHADERRQYKSAAHLVNRKLKMLGNQLGLNVALTTYVARHTWASLALSTHVPISTISEAMGHDSEATTRIYLAQLDTSAVDQANAAVLGLL